MYENLHIPAGTSTDKPGRHKLKFRIRHGVFHGIQARLIVKKIIIKSTVLSAAMITTLLTGANAQAGVFDQLAAVANSALPAYGRVQTHSAIPDLEPEQIEAGIKEIIAVASDRVVASVGAGSFENADGSLSSDMRRARKLATKLGYEESFEQLQKQVNEAVIAAVPATSELLKATIERIEFTEPRTLLISHDTAATDFLRSRVSGSLHRQLQPLLVGLLEDSGASGTSAMLASQIKFGTLLDTIVENHVLEQSIDGFFDQLEVEESFIRQNPESQTTSLLKRVFG